MNREAGERLTPGTRLAGGGVFLCRADDEGAWVAWPNAAENVDRRPSLEAKCWDEIEISLPSRALVCCYCEWHSDDGTTRSVSGRLVPADPEAKHGDYCPLCGHDGSWPGRLAAPCSRCEGSGFDGRCIRCGGGGREPLP